MMVNHGTFFEELGFVVPYYNKEKNEYIRDAIIPVIETINATWKSKYPGFEMKSDRLVFDTLLDFNQSFATEIEGLNMETQ